MVIAGIDLDFKHHRVKLAIHKDTPECVAVKMVSMDDTGEELTLESLKKEVSFLYMISELIFFVVLLVDLYHEDVTS